MGGAFESIDELKSRLVGSQADRVRRIETGELQVVGVNCFTETADSPLAAQSGAGKDGEGEGEAGRSILKVDPAVEPEMRADVAAWRSQRDGRVVTEALGELRRDRERTRL